jgi:hypothetical protein
VRRKIKPERPDNKERRRIWADQKGKATSRQKEEGRKEGRKESDVFKLERTPTQREKVLARDRESFPDLFLDLWIRLSSGSGRLCPTERKTEFKKK